jgi:hypothetical protein
MLYMAEKDTEIQQGARSPRGDPSPVQGSDSGDRAHVLAVERDPVAQQAVRPEGTGAGIPPPRVLVVVPEPMPEEKGGANAYDRFIPHDGTHHERDAVAAPMHVTLNADLGTYVHLNGLHYPIHGLFHWTLVGPEGFLGSLANADKPGPSFFADVPGTYTAYLDTDDGKATFTIHVAEKKE